MKQRFVAGPPSRAPTLAPKGVKCCDGRPGYLDDRVWGRVFLP